MRCFRVTWPQTWRTGVLQKCNKERLAPSSSSIHTLKTHTYSSSSSSSSSCFSSCSTHSLHSPTVRATFVSLFLFKKKIFIKRLSLCRDAQTLVFVLFFPFLFVHFLGSSIQHTKAVFDCQKNQFQIKSFYVVTYTTYRVLFQKKVTVIPKMFLFFSFFVIVIIVYNICLCRYFSLNMLILVLLIFLFFYSASYTSWPALLLLFFFYSCNPGGVHLKADVWSVLCIGRCAGKRCTLLC